MTKIFPGVLWNIISDYLPIIENALMTMMEVNKFFKSVLTYRKEDETFTLLTPSVCLF